MYQYTGEPTADEIRHRLKDWKSWSPGAYKDNHLRITLTCPCCNSHEHTDWIRNQYHVCYDCVIAFETDDTKPVVPYSPIKHIEVYDDIEMQDL